MESDNIAQIIAPISAPIMRSLTRGQETEARFLSLRLLNKRGRIRLSTVPIDYRRLPGKSSLLAVGNEKGCLVAAVRKEDGNFLLLSTLSEFRTAVELGQPEPEPFIHFTPQQSLVRVPGTPNIIKFAIHDERLIIGFVEGPILIYSTNDLYVPTRTQVDPIHVFPGDASTIPRDILPNPGESPELIAILRGVHGQEPGHQVDVLDIQQLKHIAGWRKGSDLNTAPVSISWSPKGKQIAVGLQSGDILSYNPLSAGSLKSHLSKPPSIPPAASSLLSITWLTNASFHTIFSSPEASSSLFEASKSPSLTKTHVISTHDSKSQSAIDVELQDPSPPFGAQIPPGPLSIVLRNWSPAKFIIICGDGPSPDIGLIGSLSPDAAPDAWVNFTLEETSTPSLPLGEDTQDMALLGLEIDLTSSKPVRMSEQPDDGTPDLPPSPILYAYMSDGTVVAWHVLNTTGNVYPGMATVNVIDAPTSSTQVTTEHRMSMEELDMSSPRMLPDASPKPTSLPPSSQTQAVSAFGQTSLTSPSASMSIAPAKGFGAFGGMNSSSKFGSTGSAFAGGSAPSAFGTSSAPSAFGSSGFGGTSALAAAPAFGSPGFGQTSAAPAFGAPGFGSKPAAPAFGAPGFGSKPPAPAFGAPSFGSKPAAPAFGQSGFGSLGSSVSTSLPSTGGFAAFANQGSSAFGVPVGSALSSESKPTQSSSFGTASSSPGRQSAFGVGGSGQATTSAASAFGVGGSGPATSFGQQLQRPVGPTAFGQPSTSPGLPSFGKPAAPAFGQSGFSSSSPPNSSISSTGGFAAFANQGTSTFGTPVGSGFSSEIKPIQSSPFGTAVSPSGRQSAFGVGGSGQATASSTSAFGAGGSGQATVTPTSAFGTGGSGPATPFGQQQLGQTSSPFGPKAATPAFGQTGFGNTTPSATSQAGAFSNFDSLGNSLKSNKPSSLSRFGSPPGSPPSPGESPPSSPKHPSTSSQPLKPASSYLKPAEGFGAFVKPSGAFAAPGGVPKPVAPGAFASPSPQSVSQVKSIVPGPLATSSSTTTPTFGSTSALGRSKHAFGASAFGTVPQAAVGEISKSITGGFEAFSSGASGFASFANVGKSTSFDDILSSGDQDKPKSVDTPLAFGIASNVKPSSAPVFKTPIEQKVLATPAAGKSTDIASTTQTAVGKATGIALTTQTAGDKVTGTDAKDAKDQERSPEGSKTSQEPSPSLNSGQDSSFSLLSLSEAASQVELSSAAQMPTGSSAKKSEGEVSGDTEEEESNTREDVEDAASEPFSLTDDGFDESASDKSSRSRSRSLSQGESEEPENIQLPESPTPRSTPASAQTPLPPTPKLPVVDLSPSLPTSAPSTSPADKFNTTTPPGSPESPTGPIPTLLAPKPPIPPPTASPFGLGLGRPSSRPIRSSPLASAPITSTDEEDPAPDTTSSRSAPAIVNVRPAEPKAPFGQLSSPPQVPSTEPPVGSRNDTSSSANRRPQTPPLLSTSPATSIGSTASTSSFVSGQPQALPVSLKASKAPVPLLVTTSAIHPPASPASEEDTPKHPLQIEFQRTYQEMVNELVQLYKKAQEMALILPAISGPRGLDKLVLNKHDFVPGKYSHGDLKFFAIMIGTLQKRVVPLLDQGKSNKGLLQDLQNLALISETKQEELSRWARAREDPEFAKTLKPRALGPEHLENQIRLRKALQIAHDRIQQCEDKLESLKKRLEQHKSGKVGLRPPSLDTIDRTCRNIQLALEERMKLLDQLNNCIDALSPQTSQRLHSSPNHTRTPYQKPGTVTPPFASVAAAALNSERSSLKLKNALLSARKEPLFTTDVAKLKTTKAASLGSQVIPQIQRPEWKLPPVPPLSTVSSSVNRRNARTGKKHGAVQLKASSPGSEAKPVAFDWGPLPGVAPMEKLSQDVRATGPTRLTRQEVDGDGEWEEAA